jgi:hypothetical protein
MLEEYRDPQGSQQQSDWNVRKTCSDAVNR